MRFVHSISEAEVVSTFLGAELDSSRYGEKLRNLLARDEQTVELLRQPNLTNGSTFSSSTGTGGSS